ncbi:tetratricopeptide repeat protein [Taibaiella soli]|uniref:Tetratricopeptide repeat protein n=1 Tax=Taibaiella soli TaxID=1649169 RepID=A0A2W2AX60_9BACT|nr:tetratricopeptide repeat protein [Taibaiella soli]PZF72298.1 hypothetical protein DN068_13135 [Taibaiella soli]
MKAIYGRILTCVSMVICMACTQAQSLPEQALQKSDKYKDSILHNYLEQGAWLFPYYSESWQIYVDSALLFLPQEAYLWQQKGMPYFKKMKYQAGMRFLDSAVKYDRRSYIDYRAFMKCIFQKDYVSALDDFWEAKNVNGNSGVMDHPYNFYIGLCHLQLNHFDSAQIYLEGCVEEQLKNMGKDWVHPLRTFYSGVACFENNQYSKAIAYFDQSLERYPHFSDAEYYKARCLIGLKKFKDAYLLMNQADEDFNKHITINEDNAIYERYPYQISRGMLNGYINILKKINDSL